MSATRGSLLDQWRLALAAVSDRRLSGADHAVLLHIVDRYYRDKGSARASFALLADKANVHRTTVIDSVQRLTATGYLTTVSKGRRGRASEWGPVFEYGSAQATETEKGSAEPTEKRGSAEATETSSAGTTLSTEYGSADTTPTFLDAGLQAGVSKKLTRAAATRPGPCVPVGHTAGVAARETPVGSTGSFNEFWAAYPRQQGRAKAKKLYAQLVPATVAHETLVAKARELAAHYEATGKDLTRCQWPHSWLEGEGWMETVLTPAALPARAPAKAKPVKAETKTKAKAKPKAKPVKAKTKAKAKAETPAERNLRLCRQWSKLVAARRQRYGLSPEQAAEAFGMPQSLYERLEAGELGWNESNRVGLHDPVGAYLYHTCYEKMHIAAERLTAKSA